jgi:type VI secretion system secreted protein Hcp
VADDAKFAGLPRKTLRLALPVVAALGAGSAIAVAALPDNTIHGCYETVSTDENGTPSGNLRIADSSTRPCDSSEQAIDWNQQGPQGEPGPPGANGANGNNGNNGADGTDATTTPEKTPVAQAFLTLDGIPGGSSDPAHKGQIDVLSFSWGLSNKSSSGGGSGRGGAGRPKFRTFTFVKPHDRSSGRLFRNVATGQHIKTATFSVVQNGAEVLRYKLTDVMVSDFGTNDSRLAGTDKVKLNPIKVELTFNDGTTAFTSSFDTRSNSKPVINGFSFKP